MSYTYILPLNCRRWNWTILLFFHTRDLKNITNKIIHIRCICLFKKYVWIFLASIKQFILLQNEHLIDISLRLYAFGTYLQGHAPCAILSTVISMAYRHNGMWITILRCICILIVVWYAIDNIYFATLLLPFNLL